MARFGVVIIVVGTLLGSASTAWAQSADDKAAQIEALKKRVDDLEARLARLEGSSTGSAPATDANQARQSQQLAARVRMKRDADNHSKDELIAAEQLYQVANKNWRSPEAKACLEQMVAKYPDLNRTGCAVLYLAQMAEGDKRVELLEQAINKHGDCFYGDGVQVGALGRFLLAMYHQENNQPEKAKALLEELQKQHPQAVDHRGNLLAASPSSK